MMRILRRSPRAMYCALMLAFLSAVPATAHDAPPQAPAPTFDRAAVMASAQQFFGQTSEGLAKAVEKAFGDYGRPVAFITGKEYSGALVVGARFGEGVLHRKGGRTHKIYWQGPSVGLDFGGDASKVFTLVYRLKTVSQIFQRFPAADGSLYVVAGVGVNYQKAGNIVIALIRSGVGLRAGANVGYTHYTREKSWLPL